MTSIEQSPTAVLDLVDIGVNLTHASFRDDRDDVIARAVAAGVRAMIVTGTSVAASQRALDLARLHPAHLRSTAGIHPHDARNAGETGMASLARLCADPLVVAVGECGLDFNRDFSPRPTQEAVFAAQLNLAARLGKPVFLHERDAHRRFVEILAAHPVERAVVHCFTGEGDALFDYLDRGCHIGITGWICDERRGRHLAELVRRVPLDRLMIETDAPFLTPRTMRPRPRRDRNEPAFLTHVLDAVAVATGKGRAEIAEATTSTARRFFAI